jgi:hypothetical protein
VKRLIPFAALASAACVVAFSGCATSGSASDPGTTGGNAPNGQSDTSEVAGDPSARAARLLDAIEKQSRLLSREGAAVLAKPTMAAIGKCRHAGTPLTESSRELTALTLELGDSTLGAEVTRQSSRVTDAATDISALCETYLGGGPPDPNIAGLIKKDQAQIARGLPAFRSLHERLSP